MFKATRLFSILSATFTVMFASLAVAAHADSPTTLVYNFTYSANQNINARDDANPAEAYGAPNGNGNDLAQSNGISHYGGSLNDKGTMTVQIVGKPQADRGQVVTISEAGEQIRRAPAATCIVYGNTQVMCDPNKTVYTEEYTLLRFLGSKFIDPNQLDKNKHWQISQDAGPVSATADYTILSNNNGAMQISETKKLRQAHGGSLTTDVQSKISYDTGKAVPTSVDEYVTQRHDNGVQGTSTTIYQTTLQLVSDTMAKT
ncbi:MAG TPA: hypothetical protein VGG51_12590 [Candidatus Cybelea sp.]|jgi:hypothetical protein